MYGIRERCYLNCLKYFYIADDSPLDIAHDVFEGIAIDLTTNTTVYIFTTENFDLS